MSQSIRSVLLVVPFGLALGFSVGNVGFGDFGELNAMFTFQDLRMFWTFCGAVAVAAVLFAAFVRERPERERIHRGVVPGAVLFGTGWAISGGCPAIPLIQIGSGYLPALVTIAGVAIGMRFYRVVNARWFRISTSSCGV